MAVTKLDTPKSDYQESTGTKWLVLGLELMVRVNTKPNTNTKPIPN